jgi:hypothetical protein
VIFLEIIDIEKIEESDGADDYDDVYIMHVKRYAIRTCSGLGSSLYCRASV